VIKTGSLVSSTYFEIDAVFLSSLIGIIFGVIIVSFLYHNYTTSKIPRQYIDGKLPIDDL